MRFTVFILLLFVIAIAGGGVFLATADIAPPQETIEIDVPATGSSSTSG